MYSAPASFICWTLELPRLYIIIVQPGCTWQKLSRWISLTWWQRIWSSSMTVLAFIGPHPVTAIGDHDAQISYLWYPHLWTTEKWKCFWRNEKLHNWNAPPGAKTKPQLLHICNETGSVLVGKICQLLWQCCREINSLSVIPWFRCLLKQYYV